MALSFTSQIGLMFFLFKAWCSCNSQGHLHGALSVMKDIKPLDLQTCSKHVQKRNMFQNESWISELSHAFKAFFKAPFSSFRQRGDGNGTPTTGPGQSPRHGSRHTGLGLTVEARKKLGRRTPFRKKPQRLDMKMKATGSNSQLRRTKRNKLAES